MHRLSCPASSATMFPASASTVLLQSGGWGQGQTPLLSPKIENLDTFKYLCLWSFINKSVFKPVLFYILDTQSVGMKVCVWCTLQSAAPSSLVQQKILGLLLKLNSMPPIICFQKSVKYKINTLREIGLFPKQGGKNISQCFSIFSIGIYHNCHFKWQWMALSGWNYCR